MKPSRSVSPFLEVLAKAEMSQQCHITWLHFASFSFFCLSILFPDQSAAYNTVNTARTDTIEMIQDQDHFKCKLDLPRGISGGGAENMQSFYPM